MARETGMTGDHKPIRRSVKVVAALLFILVIFIALPEAFFATYYFLRDGRWIPVSERLQGSENDYVAKFNMGENCRYIDVLYPHPYLSFVHHNNAPCRPPRDETRKGALKPANAEGFLDDRDFPLERDRDSFDILLLGGSVAAQVGQIYEGGSNFIEDALNRCYTPPLGQHFRVYNGAAGAWHEPQEAIAFLMYGKAFSGVIALEGFNEYLSMAGSWLRIEHPSNNFADLNPLVQHSYRSVAAAFLVNRMIAWAQRHWWTSHSFATYFAIDGVRNLLTAESATPADQQRTSMSTLFGLPSSWSAARRSAFNTGQYEWYLDAIAELTARNDIRAAFFLQPAPAIDKTLTDAEKSVVGDLSYGPPYLELTNELLAWAQPRNIPVYSLLPIFKDVPDTVYADAIHSVNDGGHAPAYVLMAWHIAHRLAETWGFAKSDRCGGDTADLGLSPGYQAALAAGHPLYGAGDSHVLNTQKAPRATATGKDSDASARATVLLQRVPLSTLTPQAEGKLQQLGDSVLLVSDPRQWAYSAQAKFVLPGIVDGPRIVRVKVKVDSGAIGVNWLAEDGKYYVVRRQVDSVEGATAIDLTIPAKTPGGSLLIENVADEGKPSRASIDAIEIWR
ncbi:MAG TPA: hypothetical protein VET85_16710 [Stellaceae bacterium]|nr:hypothetical protein [Stellaceae bacterium]